MDLWSTVLSREPTKAQRRRRYLWEGFVFYLAMWRRCPIRCLREAAGCILIMVAMGILVFLAR